MNKPDNVKLCEVTISKDSIRIRRANPNPLSAHQKFYLALTLMGCIALTWTTLAFFSLLQ